MKVFKFGGASVNSVDRIKNIANILQQYSNDIYYSNINKELEFNIGTLIAKIFLFASGSAIFISLKMQS